MAFCRYIASESPRLVHWPLLAMLAASIVLFRAEYVIFVPLYFVLAWLFRRLGPDAAIPAREALAAGTVCLGVGLGAAAVMAFRAADSGQFELVPREYSCWTFLDGTPQAWLRPGDDSEADRVRRGIDRFRHPAQFGYSLTAMMLNNPKDTARKFFLNLPRWLHQLGRRHVVAPLPLTALAVISLALRGTGKEFFAKAAAPLATLAAVILMTCSLALLMVYAEYMTPAFGALCVLAADGLLQLVALVVTRRRPLAARMTTAAWCTALVLLVLIMEFLLFRGGGRLVDVSDMRDVAEALDQRMRARSVAATVLIDPYNYVLDCDCRTNVVNRQLYRAQHHREYGFTFMHPTLALDSPLDEEMGLEDILLWTDENAAPGEIQSRLAWWAARGFALEHAVRIEDRLGRRWVAHFLRRSLPDN
jgi:hypothetical protein